jgi:hypothetical protein
MRNGRCRLHGGKSTGPRTEEGRARIRAARTRHGRYTAESRAFQRGITTLLRSNRELLALARQPGAVDAAALRHLAPPDFGKHLMQREAAPGPGVVSTPHTLPLTRQNPVQREKPLPPLTGQPPTTPARRPILLARPGPLAP